MGFFDEKKNVEAYLKMAEGYDGAEIIAVLDSHLPAGSTVLELGMGPGKDLDLLARRYTVTGSDTSAVFLDLYRQTHQEADLLELDASTIDTDRSFNCIFTNKVLQHLTISDLNRSFARQQEILTTGGLVMHTLWYGEGEENYEGMRFIYHTEESVIAAAGPGFETVAVARYGEMEEDDSLYVMLRKAG